MSGPDDVLPIAVEDDRLRPGDDAFRKLVGLVVDDSSSQRTMLKLLLKRWNFDVLQAADGAEALELCKVRQIDFVISDWMMPVMTGPELCKAMRNLGQKHYTYFILLTSRTEKNDVALGLGAGADDFVSKPMDQGELQARLRAGQRLLLMQEDLVDKNKRITEAFDRLNSLYQEIDRDLKSAAKLQNALIPRPQSRCGPINVGVAYQPAGYVGGDLLGFFPITANRFALYSIDVSGHGVSSALLTIRLANLLTATHLEENIAVRQLPNGDLLPRDPAAIASELNDRLQDEADNDQYFTMLYADVNIETGMVRYCQAGHSNPAIIRRNGTIEFIGAGGAPIGLIPGMSYETSVTHLEPGDRMMLFTDGITECENPAGDMLDEVGLQAMLLAHAGKPEHEVLSKVVKDLAAFAGTDRFDDDVSALLFTFP